MVEPAKTRRTFSQIFWGRMASFDKSMRITALVFVIVAMASMSFTQLGFWSIGVIAEKPVYLMLLLGPLMVGSFLFGPLAGALMGFFSGAVVYLHASTIPLDYFEIYFMTPLNTYVLLTIVGALAGWLFGVVDRHGTTNAKRLGLIALVALVVSFVTSIAVQASTVAWYGGVEKFDSIRTYLLTSPAGLVIQTLIDAALTTVLCWIVDLFVNRAASPDEQHLITTFRRWVFVVSFTVFMATSAALFAMSTSAAEASAERSMIGEIEYLIQQTETQSNPDLKSLIDGYDTETDGTVVAIDSKGTILATDDQENYPVDFPFLPLIGYEESLWSVDEFFGDVIDETTGVTAIQAADQNGYLTMDITVLAAGASKDGYIVVMRPSAMVYENRARMMASATILALILITAIGILATALLRRLVIRRIDDTNDSLAKITKGNLNEHVHARYSREFVSLSDGINTMVTALKDTIEEVEQKNAQELSAAKAIQENALPRDFPPFPEVDRFDIYASMKTAKEVGGDFYNFFLIGENKLGFLIADVSGKGIPAALFMMAAKTHIQGYMEAGLPINEAVLAANHQLCIGNDAGMFVTAFICVLDYETGVLSYVNAGHNPPLIHRGADGADGESSWEWLRDVSGMPLGLFDGMPYELFERQLDEKDVLYLYTDGVTEAMSVSGELFGEERLEATLNQVAELNTCSICTAVRRDVSDFTRGAEQSDDITMLCLKYGVPPERTTLMVLPAVDKQLVHVHDFIHEELHRHGAPKSVQNPLDIAAEELFVNVCHYAYPDATEENPGEVRLSFEYEANPPSLTVTLADDGIPYNPLAKPDAATADSFDSIADVPIGGLGILMAKQSIDEMTYEYENGSNVLRFKKGW